MTFTNDLLPVGQSLHPRVRPTVTSRAPLAAVADEAVADAAYDSHPESLRVEAEADRLDLDVMEHERQSRLHRWQEQRA